MAADIVELVAGRQPASVPRHGRTTASSWAISPSAVQHVHTTTVFTQPAAFSLDSADQAQRVSPQFCQPVSNIILI